MTILVLAGIAAAVIATGTALFCIWIADRGASMPLGIALMVGGLVFLCGQYAISTGLM